MGTRSSQLDLFASRHSSRHSPNARSSRSGSQGANRAVGFQRSTIGFSFLLKADS
jgi:hypothetical protein